MQVRQIFLFAYILKCKRTEFLEINWIVGVSFVFRNDLSKEEYESMKVETLDQIQEFTVTLDRLNKGDVTLNSKISSMRHVCCIRLHSSFYWNYFVFLLNVSFYVFYRRYVKQLQIPSIPSKWYEFWAIKAQTNIPTNWLHLRRATNWKEFHHLNTKRKRLSVIISVNHAFLLY